MNKNTYIEVDMVNEARKVINCVYEAKGKYGEDIIVDTLRGLSAPILFDYGTTSYSSYGSLKNHTDDDIRLLINYMVKYGYLHKLDDKQKTLSINNMEPLKDTNAQVIVKKISGSIPVEEMPYLPTKKKDINQDTENIKVSAMDVKEIVVRAEQTPGQVSFYNFEELKEYISDGLAVYNNTVYTPENLNQAERDLKVLRAVKKKLYDKKKELEEAYSLPIETVKAQIDELINMVKEPMNIIDNIVKENRKLAKKNEIMEYARRKSDILGEYADGVLEAIFL